MLVVVAVVEVPLAWEEANELVVLWVETDLLTLFVREDVEAVTAGGMEDMLKLSPTV